VIDRVFNPNNVNRYSLNPHDGEVGMEPDANGTYIEHKDYEKLLALSMNIAVEVNRLQLVVTTLERDLEEERKR
jgi:hypothetical protein